MRIAGCMMIFVFTVNYSFGLSDTGDPYIDAINDANIDTNDLKWLCCGMACPFITIGIANSIPHIYLEQRLMGRSSEYVAAYTETYSKQIRKERVDYVVIGSVIGIVYYATSAYCVISTINDYNSAKESLEGCNPWWLGLPE